MTEFGAPLSEIHGIGPRFIFKLKKLGLTTVRDLLRHFPTRYEDFSQIYPIKDLEPGQEATIQGVVKEIGGRRTWRKHLYIVEALISDESGSIRAVWFNQPYIKNVLHPGRIANFSGKVTLSGEEIYLSNPTYEVLSEYRETKHTGRIVPVYPETRGLTSKGLRFLIKPVLDDLEELRDFIPHEVLKRKGLPELNKALNDAHFPANLDDAIAAKRRFAFEDLFLLQLTVLIEKLAIAKEKAAPLGLRSEEINEIIAGLPFELTESQMKSLQEILNDLRKNRPMNRLLQGDVGSGKTVIAAIAALVAAKNDGQTAFMAPTEILARQHYGTLTKIWADAEFGIGLLTSAEAKVFYGNGLESELKKTDFLKEVLVGKIKITVGTHALIQKNVSFNNLALVVIDEQHRFGVEQRKMLLKKSKSKTKNAGGIPNHTTTVPHFLSMSATPIPRTLSLTLFGDLDLSLITELPKNRKPILTKVVSPENRNKAYAFIRGQVHKGRQVFVICPRIEPGQMSETDPAKLEIKSVKEEFEKLSKNVFPDLRVAMLHGKMKLKEKSETMKDFIDRKTDILVSTSVVEVGVDVPNATIMMIEGADRFGLAQLYQFRGRVGRGEHQSFCFLFTDSASSATRRRLESIVKAKNGFELAEKDLALRGPGEFLGEAQTGMPDLAMTALQNLDLIKEAREEAFAILKKDPVLKNYPVLKERLLDFKKDTHWE
ncbi:MAG TPA: ATP-dependent DNA helicase RecG [Candidatus Paceibacterota bacterium]|nr:ATP-dependent DNA helicase RecG [Candidatus Paceibacterota bacterium]